MKRINLNDMKILTLILAIIIISSQLAISQATKKFSISLCKENATIDSLINSASTYVHKPHQYFTFRTMHDLEYNKFYFHLIETDFKDNLIELDFTKDYYTKNLLYFTYQNCTVFVTGEQSPFNFFTKSNKKTSFEFITEINVNEDPYERRKRLFIELFVFKNGKFLPGLAIADGN